MSITLAQLVGIISTADTAVSLGHGRAKVQYSEEYPEDAQSQEDTCAFSIRDENNDEDLSFTYKALLKGRVSDDGDLLIAKDDDEHEHWLKFLEHKVLRVKDVCDMVAAVEARETECFGVTE